MVVCALGFVCAHMCHEPTAVLNLYNVILRTFPMKTIITLKTKTIFINTDSCSSDPEGWWPVHTRPLPVKAEAEGHTGTP